MAFDFIDRQVVISMFPHLKAEWGISDSQLGALVSIISITIAVGSLPVSLLTNRWSRVKSIVVVGSLWSLPRSPAPLRAIAANCCAEFHWPRRDRLRPSGWRDPRQRLSGTAARHRHRRLSCDRVCRLRIGGRAGIQLETVEHRRGHYCGPLVLNYVAIGGGASGTHPADLVEFARRTPDGAVLTVESVMRHVAPIRTIGIAMGLHVRVGIEDNLWRAKGERMTSVQQVEQMARIARELGREVTNGKEAREIYQIGTWYQSPEETLAKLGLPPNREPAGAASRCARQREKAAASVPTPTPDALIGAVGARPRCALNSERGAAKILK
jgi:hypothetical protein